MWITAKLAVYIRSQTLEKALLICENRFINSTKRHKAMRLNRTVLSVIVTVIAAISISSCAYRTPGPGYDYGYGYGPNYRYYRVPPPPPRVVVVKPSHPRVVHADRYRSSRYSNKAYRRQYNNGNHYGQRSRTRGPR